MRKSTQKVESTIGSRIIDREGVPVCVLRLDPKCAYMGVPALLQRYINESDNTAWHAIKEKIDYVYMHLDNALGTLDNEDKFTDEVKSRVKGGKKLLFKPNIVNPLNIDPVTHGETPSSNTSTEWPLIAAIMRWFHNNLDISYHQMALGEAGSAVSMTAGLSWWDENSGPAVRVSSASNVGTAPV